MQCVQYTLTPSLAAQFKAATWFIALFLDSERVSTLMFCLLEQNTVLLSSVGLEVSALDLEVVTSSTLLSFLEPFVFLLLPQNMSSLSLPVELWGHYILSVRIWLYNYIVHVLRSRVTAKSLCFVWMSALWVGYGWKPPFSNNTLVISYSFFRVTIS